MAISKLSICNSALVKIGQEPLSSMDDYGKAANLCNVRFDDIRDEVLSSYPWNFAMRRMKLNALPYDQAYEWNRFQLPADCLRIWSPGEESARFSVEGGKVLTDDATFSSQYIARIENPAEFTIAFAEAMAFRLAGEIAYAIAQSTTLQQMMMSAYQEYLRDARFQDSQSDGPQDIIESSWKRVRW